MVKKRIRPRMNARSYPCAVRAQHQITRAAQLPECPGCQHPVMAHALEGGHRVCTRGVGRVACRDCALGQATMGEPARAMFDLATALQRGRRGNPPGPLKLTRW